jgi:hypothetical protein
MLVIKRECNRLGVKVHSILQMLGVPEAFFLIIQIYLRNIPSRLKPLHHLFTSIKLSARNIHFSVFTVSENTRSFLRVKMAYEDAPVQKER